MYVDTSRHLLRELTLQLLSDPAGKLNVFDTPGHFPHRVGEHLAVLGRNSFCKFFAMRVKQLLKSEQYRRTIAQRGDPPFVRSRSGQRNRGLEFPFTSESHFGDLPSECRVE